MGAARVMRPGFERGMELLAGLEVTHGEINSLRTEIDAVYNRMIGHYRNVRVQWLKAAKDTKHKALVEVFEEGYDIEMPDYLIGLIWEYTMPLSRLFDYRFAMDSVKDFKI